uniref:Uncharacterized protein n=1 Tax=Onchocerca volvulus TaxID=6282 RepID=A0A8R1U2W9_ONCVO
MDRLVFSFCFISNSTSGNKAMAKVIRKTFLLLFKDFIFEVQSNFYIPLC